MRLVDGLWCAEISLGLGTHRYGFAVRGMVFSDRQSAHREPGDVWPWSCAVCRERCGLGARPQDVDNFLQMSEGARS